ALPTLAYPAPCRWPCWPRCWPACSGRMPAPWRKLPSAGRTIRSTRTAGWCRSSRWCCCGCGATGCRLNGPTGPGGGGPVLAAGLGLRLFGTYFHFVWLDPISLLPTLAGLCLLLGGWAAFRWAWPAIGFLAFMIPLPHSAAVALSGQLQRIATIASTFLLQTMGLPALADGNTIRLDDVEIGVVEACSGLRMLVVFFALSTGAALLIRRTLGEKLVLVASAVPIALASNILRITATGVLYQTVNGDIAQAFFHDVAGWLMMPLGLCFLWLGVEAIGRPLPPAAPAGRPRAGTSLPRLRQPVVTARAERPTPQPARRSHRIAMGPAGQSSKR